mgnify:CR=1 FL=1
MSRISERRQGLSKIPNKINERRRSSKEARICSKYRFQQEDPKKQEDVVSKYRFGEDINAQLSPLCVSALQGRGLVNN